MRNHLAYFHSKLPKFKYTLKVFTGGHSVGHPDELEASIKWCVCVCICAWVPPRELFVTTCVLPALALCLCFMTPVFGLCMDPGRDSEGPSTSDAHEPASLTDRDVCC